MHAGELRPWEGLWTGARVEVHLPWRPSPVRARGAVLGVLNGARGQRWAAKTDSGAQAPGHTRWATYHAEEYGFSVCVRGPDAWAEADHLAAQLTAVRDHQGRFVAVEAVEVQRDRRPVYVDAKRWRRYETLAPVFPARSAATRSPDPGHWSYPAWVAQVTAEGVRALLRECGWSESSNRPVVVQVEGCAPERVVWQRSDRGRDEVTGYRARFVSNAVLPRWCSIGARTAEGWGVICEID